ncbi:MAG: FmdB family zinc ribbon protein [Candidatus Omnitrophota bacterium]
MPTYNYECKICAHSFKQFQSMMDEPVKECPECSGLVKRLISQGAGIIFKGKGFYQTDYKNVESKCDKKPDPKQKTPVCGASEDCSRCKCG